MLKKRLLYFSAGSVSAFLWKRGELTAEIRLENNEAGLAAFSEYASIHRDSLFYLLADVVEEDFFQEVLPKVSGKDRALLLGRKLAQRYRDTTLALTATLGTETGARRDERILFSSFTNTQQFQPWLATLRSHEARLVGVYSVPFVTPQLVERTGTKAPRCLVVSQQTGGLRQTFIEGGRMRFSRLGRIDNADPARAAQNFVAESGRIQQYLTNLRLLPRDAGALDVIVIAPAGQKKAYEDACVSNPRLRFHVHETNELASTLKLKNYPRELKSEALFLHLLAENQPAEQYVSAPMRRFYRLWQARLGLIAGGAAVCAFCLLLAGVKMIDIYSIDQLIDADRSQEARAAQEYARLTQSFPKTPTNTENLKSAVKSYKILIKQTSSPQGLLIDLSQALATSPQIEIDRISWEISPTPTGSVAKSSRAAPAAKNDAASAATAAPVTAETRYQVAEINARVTTQQSSDYRSVANLVNQFVEALKKRPGWEVVGIRLPFDTDSGSALRGGAGDERSAEAPLFTVTLSRRLGV
jgi:hypothetical protein